MEQALPSQLPKPQISYKEFAFIRGYMDGAPYWSRIVSANKWAELAENSKEGQEKKIAALKVFEESMFAMEDLGKFYFALKRTSPHPINVWDFLKKFEVNSAIETEWQQDALKFTTIEDFLAKLNCPSISEIARVNNLDQGFARQTLERAVLGALGAAIDNRTKKKRVLTKTLNLVKHGTVVLDDEGLLAVSTRDNTLVVIRFDAPEVRKMAQQVSAYRTALKGILIIMHAQLAIGIRDKLIEIAPADRAQFLKRFGLS